MNEMCGRLVSMSDSQATIIQTQTELKGSVTKLSGNVTRLSGDMETWLVM